MPPGVATYVVVTGDAALGVTVLAVAALVDLHVECVSIVTTRIVYTCDVHKRASRPLVHCCYAIYYISTHLVGVCLYLLVLCMLIIVLSKLYPHESPR